MKTKILLLALAVLTANGLFAQGNQPWKTNGNNVWSNNAFLGTKNNKPLKFKTNNQLRMKIKKNGDILVKDSMHNSLKLNEVQLIVLGIKKLT